jgi:putative flippase GtrA
MTLVLQQLKRFATVGLINTGIAVSLQFMAHRFAQLTVTQAGYAGYTCAIAASYFLNHRWTFQAQKSHARTMLPFVLQSLLSAVLYAQLTGYLAVRLPYVLAIAIGVGTVFVINFLMARLIFGPSPKLSSPA